MSGETYKGLTVLLTVLCVVLLIGLTATVVNYNSALREKDEAIASLNSRLSDVEEWLRENVTYYEEELSSLREELNAREAEVELLKARVASLESRLEAFKGGKLVMVNLKGEDTRPLLGNPYLRVYGAVCNVGFETAYNCRLRVYAYQTGGVVAVDTYVILGDVEAGTWKNVDVKIYYTGGSLVNWTITPEWVNATPIVRLERLEIPTAYATYDAVRKTWTVTLWVENTGTLDVMVVDVLVNGKTFSAYWGQIAVSPSLGNGLPVLAGGAVEVMLSIKPNGFTSGQAVTITLHSLSGQDYSKNVVLP
ncbi:MAG: hypothetical protein QXI36_01065 [Candidatus Bathyarchaeia archaeon]